MNPTALVDGFSQRASQLLKSGTTKQALIGPKPIRLPSMMWNAENALSRGVGIKNLENFHSESALRRFMARMLAGDGQMWDAEHEFRNVVDRPTGWSRADNTKLDEALQRMGKTVHGRSQFAKGTAAVGAGGLGIGALAYGAGRGQGEEKERRELGHEANVMLHHLPLRKRLEFGLNTIFNPGDTGDQIQRSLM